VPIPKPRWQLPSDQMMQRLTGSQMHRFGELVPAVFPVVILGEDRDDVSRSIFACGVIVTGAAGQLATIRMRNPVGAFELLAAWFNGTAGQLVTANSFPPAAPLAGSFAQTPTPWSTGGRVSATAVETASLVVGDFPTALRIELEADDTPWLAVPAVVQPGFQIGWQLNTVATQLVGCFVWRDL